MLATPLHKTAVAALNFVAVVLLLFGVALLFISGYFMYDAVIEYAYFRLAAFQQKITFPLLMGLLCFVAGLQLWKLKPASWYYAQLACFLLALSLTKNTIRFLLEERLSIKNDVDTYLIISAPLVLSVCFAVLFLPAYMRYFKWKWHNIYIVFVIAAICMIQLCIES